LRIARKSRVVVSSTVSAIITATAACGAVSTTRISGRILSLLKSASAPGSHSA
jgi:hypothetical protein